MRPLPTGDEETGQHSGASTECGCVWTTDAKRTKSLFRAIIRQSGPLPLSAHVAIERGTGEHLLVVTGNIKAIGEGTAGFKVYIDDECIAECTATSGDSNFTKIPVRACIDLDRRSAPGAFSISLVDLNDNTISDEDCAFEVRLLIL